MDECKPLDDGDCLPQLAETWRAMIAFGNGGGGKPEMAAAAAATARRFVDWVDIGLFTSEAFMGSILALLGSQHGRTLADIAHHIIKRMVNPRSLS